MQPVYITDPAWWTTFRHLVEPLPDEWLPGLLLRCDEVNSWEAGTTIALFTQSIRWRGHAESALTVPSGLDLSFLAKRLALSTDDLLASTYQRELARCYGTHQSHFKQLSTTYRVSLCPECLVQNRKLQRQFMLPHITCCPEHHLVLLVKCNCGYQPYLFSGRQPFTCHSCGLDWARLPRCQAEPMRILYEQRILSYYEFFFLQGTAEILEKALQLVTHRLAEKELEYLRASHSGSWTQSRYKPRSSYRRSHRSQSSYTVGSGEVLSIRFHQGNVVLGDLVGLLATLELSPFHLINGM
jgi:hypothetical protein